MQTQHIPDNRQVSVFSAVVIQHCALQHYVARCGWSEHFTRDEICELAYMLDRSFSLRDKQLVLNAAYSEEMRGAIDVCLDAIISGA